MIGRAPLTPTQRRDRWIILGILLSPIIGSFVYNRGWQIPGLVCPLYHFTGIPCPSCGLTRSFMAMARGDVLRAVQFHAFGPLLYGVFLLLALHLLLELVLNRAIVLPYWRWLARHRVHWGILGLFLGYYLWRLATWYQRGELPGRVVW
ncbi:MAG: DUF2752 domain-containing protein [Gloeomargarita sp. SKYG116]|nr:DUF2752 domain-containing protein [Gloeomargarita sp. SKYG116]MCS7292305.1 DUF2752 domain-containing protein [Gloeomargarita sp. SKYB120]MDW8177865.1 DUF2752 domain-containing protein [Gloeomargarita sp. SKYBB_i_bin120]MDW8400451.1 DUF2752 domain-containing protein [Gloeomargarita sp. SKYGB_i_bin116]